MDATAAPVGRARRPSSAARTRRELAAAIAFVAERRMPIDLVNLPGLERALGAAALEAAAAGVALVIEPSAAGRGVSVRVRPA